MQQRQEGWKSNVAFGTRASRSERRAKRHQGRASGRQLGHIGIGLKIAPAERPLSSLAEGTLSGSRRTSFLFHPGLQRTACNLMPQKDPRRRMSLRSWPPGLSALGQSHPHHVPHSRNPRLAPLAVFRAQTPEEHHALLVSRSGIHISIAQTPVLGEGPSTDKQIQLAHLTTTLVPQQPLVQHGCLQVSCPLRAGAQRPSHCCQLHGHGHG